MDPCREGVRPTARAYDHTLGLPDAMPMVSHVEMKVRILRIIYLHAPLPEPSQA